MPTEHNYVYNITMQLDKFFLPPKHTLAPAFTGSLRQLGLTITKYIHIYNAHTHIHIYVSVYVYFFLI